MKNLKLYFLFILLAIINVSCLTTKEVRYLQPNEHLAINEYGLIPYSDQPYKINKTDMLSLSIVTTPKGDAAQFYSSLYGSSEGQSANQNVVTNSGNNGIRTGGGNATIYFNGLKINSNGNIDIFGIGEIPAVDRTIEDIQKDIQDKVNENFLVGKSQVRLNLDGLTYYMLTDVETGGNLSGEKKSYTPMLSITEAIAQNGGLDRTIDRKNIILQRKYPEGIKRVKLDLTRDDIMNSPYFWLQNGDMIYLSTRSKSLYGFGKEPIQTLTTGVSLITTALSVYLLISRF
ncbi:polysaccharide biosynthesis/export family protein [Riemerella columbina]|uniref:polysaccharide biosynthesis/export family protein n=1 Tax=Riemerella columbina TaxID=103810 RepID=UPI00037F8AF4|nr:polysaccharide biosynthesis/export family protein [Riemerella columbina]